MIAIRVEQQVIKKSHPKYKIIDEMCFNSKNLYNYANYIIRQKFIEDGKYISYKEMNKELKTHKPYKLCGSQPANCVLRLLDKNWKSYFKAIKDWKKHPDKYLGMPKIPKYLKKDGRYNWMIPNNSCIYDKENGEIYFRVKKLQGYHWKSRCIGRLIQVRFIPKGSCYVMEAVYETEVPDLTDSESFRIAAIDLGVNNLITMSNNIGVRPIIINGKKLKAINQLYNKQRAELQSDLKKKNGQNWSRKLNSLTFKRYCRVKNYIHNATAYVIKWCVDNDIDTLIVGHSNKWKQDKKKMQNFISIPYDLLLKQLKTKCETAGIKYIQVEESYTSGTSYLDGELPVKECYNKDRRIVRGLFQAKNTLINSDVNGSLQIMNKVSPNSYTGYGVEVNLTPIVINVA